ncbi:CsbD family protein [Protofrankia sp. BMG5.30]|uniref:CsbD family protein n=2 Tax=Protofrankia TaxID=2994361 RepID=UPI0020CA318A|nr:CsbD family protein [Protofrankia sp. BMG5.30]
MTDKVRNTLHRLRGKGRRSAGRVTGDREMEARGGAEKTRGDLKQAGENVRDAFS